VLDVDLVVVIAGVCTDGVDTKGDASLTGWFDGVMPFATATFEIPPASRSPCVIAWVAEQLTTAPGANDAAGIVGAHNPSTALASVIVTFESVTFPVFVAVIA
jgi:hypothetical protein